MEYKKRQRQLRYYKKRSRVCMWMCIAATCILSSLLLFETMRQGSSSDTHVEGGINVDEGVDGVNMSAMTQGTIDFFQYPRMSGENCAATVPWRASDGSDHGMKHWHGAARTRLGRYEEPGEYTQHYDERGRPNARNISNVLCAKASQAPDEHASYTSLVWIFGQFLDHALSMSPPEHGAPKVHTNVTGDAHFDPHRKGATIEMDSADYVEEPAGHRQPFSIITHFVDGNVLYGSSPERTAALRAFDGTGCINTNEVGTDGRFPPNNTLGLENEGGRRNKTMFLFGDFRGNENVALASLHVLFLREHNYQARRLGAVYPEWGEECRFQAAKKIVVAEFQKIVYEEFLPALLGSPIAYNLNEHGKAEFNRSVDPRIYVEFAGAAYRLHPLVTEHLFAHDPQTGAAQEHVRLVDGFANPDLLRARGISPFLLGAALHKSEKMNLNIVDSLRNLLFAHTRSGPLDLAVLNIMRGRQLAVPPYTRLRTRFGLPAVRKWEDLTADIDVQNKLTQLYGAQGFTNLDAWVGLMAEDAPPGKLLGPLHEAILRDQFMRLRDGDAFFYKWDKKMTHSEQQYLDLCSLREIVLRNTRIADAHLPANLFLSQ